MQRTFTKSLAYLRMIASPVAGDASEVALGGDSSSIDSELGASAGAGAVDVSPVAVLPSESFSQSCV